MTEMNEKILPDAGNTEQERKKDVCLYSDPNITGLIMQVIAPTLEIIRLLGADMKRYITMYLCSAGLDVIYHVDGESHKLVDVYIPQDENHEVVYEARKRALINAADTMTDLLGSIRKEFGYEN